MAVRFYDEALASKIQNWISDDRIRVLKPDETTRLFEMKADEAHDNPIKLPLIALSRGNEIEILTRGKRPLSFDGLSIKAYNDEGEEVKLQAGFKLNAIPIRLSYQLDIYTKNLAEADEYMRNFVFNFVNYPKLSITFPYNDSNIKHESVVYIDTTITDNSDIPQRLFPSQFTRYTIGLEMDDAYLFSVPVKDYVAIEGLTIRIMDKPNTFSGTYVDEEVA